MGFERRKKFFQDLNSLKNERKYIHETIDFFHNSIDAQSDMIKILVNQDKNLSCIEETFGHVVQDDLFLKNETDYNTILILEWYYFS